VSESTNDDPIVRHIIDIRRREDDENVVIADALHRYAWPDGGLDRSDPKAPMWLKRVLPKLPENGPEPIPLTCGCEIDRCLVCN